MKFVNQENIFLDIECFIINSNGSIAKHDIEENERIQWTFYGVSEKDYKSTVNAEEISCSLII